LLKYLLKIDLTNFCELLFDFFTFLGVSVIESLINGEQKLDSKKKIKILFFNLFKVYSTIKYDENKQNNNHTVALINGEIGLIVNFYQIQTNKFAVIQLLKKESYDFKIYHSPPNISSALKRINDCLMFCNLTNNLILIPVSNIKEKILLIASSINSKASFFGTKIIERHD
jgi:hypothetical protein